MTGQLPKEVADTSGARYRLGRLLGRGGQGAVYAVQGRPLAVKLLNEVAPSAVRRVQESIARVRRYPLEGLHVARPLRALEPPSCGYVMDLVTGMVPLATLTFVPRAQADDLAPWHVGSGGLLRRLRLLAEAADLLAELHGRGLSYGDASPNNVFVSEEVSGGEVWLIDCDNLQDGVNARAYYTPGYAAPELFRGRGTDSLTDAWSFAVIALQTLCVVHPFVGDQVHDGEPELEERAFAGELPWIGDPEGDNESTRGIPLEMVLTRPLQDLAETCLGAGRTDRLARPGVTAWAERLRGAADQVLVCPDCDSGYYLNLTACPWCDEPRPGFAITTVYSRDLCLTDAQRNPGNLVARDGRPIPRWRVAIQEGRKTRLSAEILGGSAGGVTLSLDGGAIVLRGDSDSDRVLRHRGQEAQTTGIAGQERRIDVSRGRGDWWLTPEETDGVHRVAMFDLHRGGRG